MDTTMLICPITKSIMEDPVMCDKGYTFERVAIERWLEDSLTNPITRDYLDKSMLRPNRIVKDIISKNPLECESDFDKNDWIKREDDIKEMESSDEDYSNEVRYIAYEGQTYLVDEETGLIYGNTFEYNSNHEILGAYFDSESGKPVFHCVERVVTHHEEPSTPIPEETVTPIRHALCRTVESGQVSYVPTIHEDIKIIIKIPEDPSTPIPEEPVPEDLDIHIPIKIISDLKEELALYGYCDIRIRTALSNVLNHIYYTKKRKNKISGARVMMKFFATSNGLQFLNNDSRFEEVTKNKLIELCYKYNLREAGVWWRNIFKTRIPVEEETYLSKF